MANSFHKTGRFPLDNSLCFALPWTTNGETRAFEPFRKKGFEKNFSPGRGHTQIARGQTEIRANRNGIRRTSLPSSGLVESGRQTSLNAYRKVQSKCLRRDANSDAMPASLSSYARPECGQSLSSYGHESTATISHKFQQISEGTG